MVAISVSSKGKAIVAVVITAYILVIAALIVLAVSIFLNNKAKRALAFLGVALIVSAGVMVMVELGLTASGSNT